MEKDSVKYLTQEAYNKLKKELEYLETDKRKEVAEQLKHAASFGDLSENAAYDDAKDAKSFLEGRILELKDLLKKVKIVEKGQQGTIQIGSKVTIKSEDSEFNVEIVAFTDVDPSKGKISYESPLGKSLIGKKQGDTIKMEIPSGIAEYEIIGVD